ASRDSLMERCRCGGHGRLLVQKVADGTVEALRDDHEAFQGWLCLVLLDLADEALGEIAPGQIRLRHAHLPPKGPDFVTESPSVLGHGWLTSILAAVSSLLCSSSRNSLQLGCLLLSRPRWGLKLETFLVPRSLPVSSGFWQFLEPSPHPSGNLRVRARTFKIGRASCRERG